MRTLAAQNLLPGEGDDIELGEIEVLREGGRGRIADRQALAISRDKIGIRNADAGGRAVPGEDHVTVEIDGGKVGKFAVTGFDLANVLELELLDDIGNPAGAEAFPGDHINAALAEQRPERHLDGTGVGSRHDADAVIRRHFQNFAGEIDRLLQLGLADFRAVRTAKGRIGKSFERPTRTFRAGARRKMSVLRTHVRLCGICHIATLPDRWLLVGEECPAAVFMGEAGHSQAGDVVSGGYFAAAAITARVKPRRWRRDGLR